METVCRDCLEREQLHDVINARSEGVEQTDLVLVEMDYRPCSYCKIQELLPWKVADFSGRAL